MRSDNQLQSDKQVIFETRTNQNSQLLAKAATTEAELEIAKQIIQKQKATHAKQTADLQLEIRALETNLDIYKSETHKEQKRMHKALAQRSKATRHKDHRDVQLCLTLWAFWSKCNIALCVRTLRTWTRHACCKVQRAMHVVQLQHAKCKEQYIECKRKTTQALADIKHDMDDTHHLITRALSAINTASEHQTAEHLKAMARRQLNLDYTVAQLGHYKTLTCSHNTNVTQAQAQVIQATAALANVQTLLETIETNNKHFL